MDAPAAIISAGRHPYPLTFFDVPQSLPVRGTGHH